MPRPIDYPAPSFVTDTPSLTALCERLRTEPFVTVDTEFMRERTYYPELCVVQLGGAAENAVIDTMAEGLDLHPLAALMRDEAVLKVFHRRTPGYRDLPRTVRHGTQAPVRHAGRSHGGRVRRPGGV